MVKSKFLAHLPVDHLVDPVVFSLIFLLGWFAAFAYYVIDGVTWYATENEKEVNPPTLQCLNQQAPRTDR